MLIFKVVCPVNSWLLRLGLWCFLPLRRGFNHSRVAYHIPQRSGFTEHWLEGSGGNSQRKMKDGPLRSLCSVSSFLCHKQNSARLFVLKHIILINRGNHTTLRASRLQGDAPNKYSCGNSAEKVVDVVDLRVNLVKYSLIKKGSSCFHGMFNCSSFLNRFWLQYFSEKEMHCCKVLHRICRRYIEHLCV